MNINVEELQIKSENKGLLDTLCYIPENVKPLSTILFRTPYGKSNINAILDPISIVKMGFAIVVQDVRGRFGSNDKFVPFLNEKVDGKSTIDWICEQVWSNGKVFTMGISYEGFTALMSANDERVVACAPIMSSPYIHRDWFFENNCVKQAFVQSWSHSFAFTDNGNMLSHSEIERIQRLASYISRLYKGSMEKFPASEYLPYYKSWINDKDSDYWNRIKLATEIQLEKISTYYVSGWYDIFCEGTLKCYLDTIKKTDIPQIIVIGPWSHSQIFSSVVGDLDFGVYSLEKVSPYAIFEWFKVIESEERVDSIMHIYVMGINKWYRMRELPSCTSVYIYMGSQTSSRSVFGDGYLLWDMLVCSGQDSFIYDSNRLVPTCGGRCIDAVPEGLGGPKFQHEIERRDDVLIYTTDVLKIAVPIIGQIKASLCCQSSQEQMDYCIKITDVDCNGNSTNIVDSCIRIDINACEKTVRTANLGTVAHAFLPGHKIRCVISSSNFPRLSLQNELLEITAVNTIYWGKGFPSFIELPVVELEL